MFKEVLFDDVVFEATEVTIVTELFVEFALAVVVSELVVELETIEVVLVVSSRAVEFPDEIVWSADAVDSNVVDDVLIEEALTDVEFDTFPSVVETVVVEVVVVRDDVWLFTPLTNIVLLATTMLATVLFTEFELKVAVS